MRFIIHWLIDDASGMSMRQLIHAGMDIGHPVRMADYARVRPRNRRRFRGPCEIPQGISHVHTYFLQGNTYVSVWYTTYTIRVRVSVSRLRYVILYANASHSLVKAWCPRFLVLFAFGPSVRRKKNGWPYGSLRRRLSAQEPSVRSATKNKHNNSCENL